MSIPYTNAYYSQFYLGYQDAIDYGAVPLPPCADAWSTGPAADQDTVAVRWISSATFSKSTLIKDDDDIFYHVSAYIVGINIVVYADVYDAENNIDNSYTITAPTQLTFANLGTDGWQWLIRKKSATEMDFVVRGLDGSANMVYQHYTWTIGAGTMTYAGGFSYASGTYGNSLCLTLQGNRVIDAVYKSPVLQILTYDLDTQSSGTTELYDSTGLTAFEDWAYAFYHAGAYFHCLVFEGRITAASECEGTPYNPVINKAASLTVDALSFPLSGDPVSFTDTIDTVAGHDCYIKNLIISGGDLCSMNPDTGKVYFFFSYDRGSSTDMCYQPFYTPPIAISPDIEETIAGYMSFDGAGCGYYHFDTAPATIQSVIGPGRYVFPSRIDPISIVYEGAGDPTYILHWPSAVMVGAGFVPYEIRTTTYGWTLGGGQRNDNQPLLISTVAAGTETPMAYMHNVWQSINGATYVDQTTEVGITNWNYYPIQGFMGKWPVHHNAGIWSIFGPNTPVEAGARWQVA